MQHIIYFFIALAATTVGSLTGMGGGVIIKPLLDILGDYNAANIGVLSSITVLTMSIVSVFKQTGKKGNSINLKIAISLAIGSIVGGIVGEKLLTVLMTVLNANNAVVKTQNICLALIIIGIFFYMLNKEKIRTLHMTGITASLLTGLLLGLISSFLGIGGGPINVVLLTFVFSMDIKAAATCSIITILFAQISKLSAVFAFSGFAVYNLSMLPVMVTGAIIGGFVGSWLCGRMSEKTVSRAFNAVQILVFVFCIINIVHNF